MTTTPLVVIVGETGSGKSALGMDLAQRYNGEIISADSRAIYKGMDIGTAKPTKADQAQIRHHLIDVLEPNQRFSAANFKKLAEKAIEDISKRGKLPILVGGTGLYVDSVIYDFSFSANSERNLKNPRHALISLSDKKLRNDTLIIGLRLELNESEVRLKKRVDQMIKTGLVEEIKTLAVKYSPDLESMKGTIYSAFQDYIKGAISLEEAKKLCVTYDLQFAKKQRTWFKRNKSIHWIANREQAVELVTTFLNK